MVKSITISLKLYLSIFLGGGLLRYMPIKPPQPWWLDPRLKPAKERTLLRVPVSPLKFPGFQLFYGLGIAPAINPGQKSVPTCSKPEPPQRHHKGWWWKPLRRPGNRSTFHRCGQRWPKDLTAKAREVVFWREIGREKKTSGSVGFCSSDFNFWWPYGDNL